MMFPTIMLAASLAAGSPVVFDGAQAIIPYADLDLTTEAGRQTLDRRVAGSIRRLCGDRRVAPLAERRAAERCRSAALQDAQGKVDMAVARTRMNRQIADASLASAETR